MEHLFREYEMKEKEVAGIRTGRFKTALGKEGNRSANVLQRSRQIKWRFTPNAYRGTRRR